MEREFCLYNEIASNEESFWGPADVTTPPMLNEALSECEKGDVFNLYINSPGGSVFAAIAMSAMIDRAREKGIEVNAYIDGVAASAASFLVMACDSVKAYDSSFMMMHKPWSFCAGNAEDMRKEAETLDNLEYSSLIPMYMRKAKVSEEEISVILENETWLNSSQMADTFDIEKIEGEKDVKQFDEGVFEKYGYHAPKELIARARERPEPVIEEAPQGVEESYYQNLKNQIDCI